MRIEVILNSDQMNVKKFQTEDEGMQYAEQMKSNPNIVDIAVYDLEKPIGEECLISWSKIEGVWENF
jgi:hypothetical protein